ncbi:hypothetical protein QZH41_011388 [Actinostola sp. cb2023]|nr:hypothetical protein QZH41_011388 [Actinostola sp. cb2023]
MANLLWRNSWRTLWSFLKTKETVSCARIGLLSSQIKEKHDSSYKDIKIDPERLKEIEKSPSGWVPPAEKVPDFPFFMKRSKMNNLPVYTDFRGGGTRHITIIRKIKGDLRYKFQQTLFPGVFLLGARNKRQNIPLGSRRCHNLFVSLICQTFASKTAPGQKKLGKVICPDPWKSGATNVTEGGGRKLNENKLLTQKKNRFSPYSEFKKCRICKDTVHQKHSHYCQGADKCSRICAMCGKKVLDTSKYRQSSA